MSPYGYHPAFLPQIVTEELVEDAADRDARTAAERAEEEKRELARRSQAIQRELPRPTMVNAALAGGDAAANLSDTQLVCISSVCRCGAAVLFSFVSLSDTQLLRICVVLSVYS